MPITLKLNFTLRGTPYSNVAAVTLESPDGSFGVKRTDT